MITLSLTYHRAMMRAFVAAAVAIDAAIAIARRARRAVVIRAARHSSAYWRLSK